jgi:hypothetical protein
LTYTFASGFNFPAGEAFDADGNLYVANVGAGTVSEVTPAKVVSTFASGFNAPEGLAFDAAGNLYVANVGANTVSKVTPARVVSTFASGFKAPEGLAFDAAGNLYVLNAGTGTVSEVTPAGVVSAFAAGFDLPKGLAIDAAGNLFVANAGANTVSEVSNAVTVPYTLGGTATAGVDYSGVTASPNGTATVTAFRGALVVTGTLVFAPGQTTEHITGTLLPDPGGVQTITFTLGTPSSNAVLGSASTNTLTIVEPDPALTAGVPTPPTTVEGQPLDNVVLFHFTDADPNATPADYTATVTWGDGSIEDTFNNPSTVQVVNHTGGGFDVIGSHTYAEELSGVTFSVSVSDSDTAPAAASDATFGVADVAVTVNANSGTPQPLATINEGQSTPNDTLIGTFTDTGNPSGAIDANQTNAQPEYTAVINWGDATTTTLDTFNNPAAFNFTSGGAFQVLAPAHTYAEEGGYNITLTISHDALAATTAVQTDSITVNDAALTPGTLTPPVATENVALTNVVLFHFSDANTAAPPSDFTATVTWGDGSVEDSTSNPTHVQVVTHAGGFDVVGSHTYAEELSGVTFSVSVADHGAAPVSASTSINAAESSDLTVTPTPLSATTNIPFSGQVATFNDGPNTDPAGDYTAMIHWGDAASSATDTAGDVSQPGGAGTPYVVTAASDPHTYAQTNAYTFTVTVTETGVADGTSSKNGTATVTALSGAVVVTGTSGDDALVITSTGPDSGTYSLNGGPAIPFTAAASFTIDGLGGNDTTTLHLANGVPLVTGDVHLDGGAGSETLLVNGAGLIARTQPGLITIADAQNQTQRVTYTNVGAIQLNGLAAADAFSGPDTADRATAFVGLTAQERFVQAVYLDELGRAGAKSELDVWAALFNAPGLSQPQAQNLIATGIGHSPEARDDLVKAWYQAYLGRQAAGGEEAGWVNLLQSGQTEEQVLSGILASPEFYARAQTLSSSGTADERYVQALYLLLLNRPGDALGASAWVNVLPEFGRHGVALNILTSTEFRTDQVEGYYNALLHRPAEPMGLNNWIFANLSIDAVRVGFESSQEFFING